MKIRNSPGPSVEPWGIPNFIVFRLQFLLVNKDELLSIVKATSEKVVGNTAYAIMTQLFNKIWWSTLLKAFFRSKNTAAVARLFDFE